MFVFEIEFTFMIKLKFAPNLLFQRLPDDDANTRTKTTLKMMNIDKEQKIGHYFFAEVCSEHLNIGKDRRFHKVLQLKISANS